MKNFVKSGIIGIVSGFINGLFGSGGGTLVVPAMEKILNVRAHRAHATAIAVILPLSVISSFIYIKDTSVDWSTMMYVSLGGVCGGFIGAKLLKKFTVRWLHITFGLFMIIASMGMIFR